MTDSGQFLASLEFMLKLFVLTLAISLQPLFSPRMTCSLCSSSGVHGVFVLPFFLDPVSVAAGFALTGVIPSGGVGT